MARATRTGNGVSRGTCANGGKTNGNGRECRVAKGW